MNYRLKAEACPVVEVLRNGVMNRTGGAMEYIPFTSITGVLLSIDKKDVEILAGPIEIKIKAWEKSEALFTELVAKLEELPLVEVIATDE